MKPIIVAVAFLVGSALGSTPTSAEELQVAEGAAKRCVSGPMAGLNIVPQTRDVTVGPFTWHDQYNPVTGGYENVGRSISWGGVIPDTDFGLRATYNDLRGVCLGYGDEVDKFVNGLE